MSTQPPFNPQGPQPYSSSAGGPPAPTATDPGDHGASPAKKNRNVIAIVALVLAIIGFIFAVMKGAYLLGWILLPIAFVLSLVALFRKDKPKKMAVVALIITLVGTLAGAIAFVTTIGKAFDEAISETETTTRPADEQPAEDAPAEEPGDDAPAGEQGTRENPYPLGTTLANEDWEVTVNSYTPDATDEVMAENEFNDEPESGHAYALANLTITYVGEESGTPWEVGVAYVTSDGNVTDTFDNIAVGPEPLSDSELYTGASATGNVVLHVPQGDDGLLRINAGMLADDVFVAIK